MATEIIPVSVKSSMLLLKVLDVHALPHVLYVLILAMSYFRSHLPVLSGDFLPQSNYYSNSIGFSRESPIGVIKAPKEFFLDHGCRYQCKYTAQFILFGVSPI
jgi:hypothetical protein